jgi:hypothetical protein
VKVNIDWEGIAAEVGKAIRRIRDPEASEKRVLTVVRALDVALYLDSPWRANF